MDTRNLNRTGNVLVSLSPHYPMTTQLTYANAVSTQYSREKEAMVYGKYKENGYQVNPLVALGGSARRRRVSRRCADRC